MGSIGNIDINKYAENHNDIFLASKLTQEFSNAEIKNMIDKISKFYSEFGIDSTKHKLVYTLSADSNLENDMATASTDATGVIRLNPQSTVLKRDDFTTIYHELGHLLDIRISQVASHNANSPNFANRVILEAWKKLKKQSPDITQQQAVASISNYSISTNREAISDAVRNYFTGKQNDMSVAIVNVLKKYVKYYLK